MKTDISALKTLQTGRNTSKSNINTSMLTLVHFSSASFIIEIENACRSTQRMLVKILAGLAINLSSQLDRPRDAAWLLDWFDLFFDSDYWQDIEEEVRLYSQSVHEEPLFDKFLCDSSSQFPICVTVPVSNRRLLLCAGILATGF